MIIIGPNLTAAVCTAAEYEQHQTRKKRRAVVSCRFHTDRTEPLNFHHLLVVDCEKPDGGPDYGS
jgi:hypothetical protein